MQWLESLAGSKQAGGFSITVFTLEIDSAFEASLNRINKNVSIVVQNNSSKLLKLWMSEVSQGDSVGVSWEADKFIFRFFFAKGMYRLIIMRPYLESISLLGCTRFVSKQAAMWILRNRKNVQIARLSIPFSSRDKASSQWIRDGHNSRPEIVDIARYKIPDELSGLDNAVKIISLPGYLQARKNPRIAYELTRQIRELIQERVVLVFAGGQDKEFKRELDLISDVMFDVLHIDRFLQDDELWGIIRRSNLVILPYSNRGASGIVLNSITLGTPVFLLGSYKWKSIEQKLHGHLHVRKRVEKELIKTLASMISLSKQENFAILNSEKLPTVEEFILFGLPIKTRFVS